MRFREPTRSRVPAVALALFLGGCPSTSPPDAVVAEDTSPDADLGPPTSCPTSATRVTGAVVAPNGVDPVPDALVYLVPDAQSFEPLAAQVECGPCGIVPESALASTRSASDGSFRLRSPALDEGGTFTLVIQRGYFRHVERGVVVPGCDALTLPPSATQLPGRSSGDDTVPRIVIASSAPGVPPSAGNVNDNFGRILDLVGVDYERVAPNRDATPAPDDMLSLLSSAEALREVHVLIVPCGALGRLPVVRALSLGFVLTVFSAAVGCGNSAAPGAGGPSAVQMAGSLITGAGSPKPGCPTCIRR